MKSERLYTTREVAEMWNVSPSTIKRWADSGALNCQRTPGGHRKFSMKNISDFQAKQGFEATGLLSTEKWEDPEIELAVNQKNFDWLRRQVLALGVQNQRLRVRRILERLHIRGLDLCDLYDEMVMPVVALTRNAAPDAEDIFEGHQLLLINNLDEAIAHLVPKVSRKRPNDKIALCGSLNGSCRLQVNAMSRILEVEGWDAYNLGGNVSFQLMGEMVKREPIELVCVCCNSLSDPDAAEQGYTDLAQITQPYRIPILLSGRAFAKKKVRKRFPESSYVKNFRLFRRQAVSRVL